MPKYPDYTNLTAWVALLKGDASEVFELADRWLDDAGKFVDDFDLIPSVEDSLYFGKSTEFSYLTNILVTWCDHNSAARIDPAALMKFRRLVSAVLYGRSSPQQDNPAIGPAPTREELAASRRDALDVLDRVRMAASVASGEEPQLTAIQKACLQALSDLEATDRDTRKPQRTIAKKARGEEDEQLVKRAMTGPGGEASGQVAPRSSGFLLGSLARGTIPCGDPDRV